MHFPVAINIGSFPLPLHTVAETMGIFIGFRYFIYLRKKEGDAINTPNRAWILIAAIFGSFLGSRLVGGLENPKQLMNSGNMLLYFYENKTVLGGFLGGLFAVEGVKRIIAEKNASGDLFVYPIILALMIGRVGCFSMGVYEETYGTETSLPWGMNLGDGLSRHPVALYEIIFLLFLWVGLVQAEKKWTLQVGARFKIFMMGYIVFRFLLDFLKPHYTYTFGLSTIQVCCVIGMIWYWKYFVHPNKLLTRMDILNSSPIQNV